jgi:hypothetical protein
MRIGQAIAADATSGEQRILRETARTQQEVVDAQNHDWMTLTNSKSNASRKNKMMLPVLALEG